MLTSQEKRTTDNTSKIFSQVDIICKSVVCFVANCLSSMTIDLGSRSSLAKSASKSTTLNDYFRRSYNLKFNIPVTNIISALIASVMLTLGNKYDYPYLYIPWLLSTLKGIAFLEGPTLFKTAYKLVANAQIPTGSFIIITLLLFIEQLFLWNEMFWNFKKCWDQYVYCKVNKIDMIPVKECGDKKRNRLLTAINKDDEVDFKFGKVEECQVPYETDDELSKLLCSNTGSDSSDSSMNVKGCNSITEKTRRMRSKYTDMTG